MNRQNLNVNFSIPIVSVPGRGKNFSFAIVYDSLVWQKNGTVWSPVTNQDGNPTWGWKKDSPSGRTTFKKTTQTIKCFDEFGGWWWAPKITWSNYAYTDFEGTRHGFSVSAVDNACNGSFTGTFTGFATDGSGYHIDINNPDSPYVQGANGLAFPFGETVTDTNGNYITKIVVSGNETHWKDTAGRIALKVIKRTSPNCVSYAGGSYPECQEYKYVAPDGTEKTITLYLQSFGIKTNFGCSGMVNYDQPGKLLPVQIDLPNNRSYTFEYETTPQDPTKKTGRVAKVTLPTGGSYEYTYPDPNNGINCADGTVSNMTRTIRNGTPSVQWTYARTQVGSDWKTTVTPPVLPYDGTTAHQSTFTFNSSGQLLSEKYYQGSETGGTLLRTLNTTWAANGTPSSKTFVLDGQQSKIETGFDTYGNLQEVREYDWGAPGSPVRTTQITYLAETPYTSRNIRNRPTQILVRQGGPSGTIRSQTDIRYDEAGYINTSCPPNVPQHDDTNYGCSFTYRGNPTTVTTYADAAAGSGAVARHSYYDFFGNLRKADVSCCQQKQWNFSAITQYAYPDSVVSGPPPPGSQLTTSATYHFDTGLVLSLTDPNNKVTSFSYDLMKRLTRIDRADGAAITSGYEDAQRKVTQNIPIQGLDVLTQVSEFDLLGRLFLQSVSSPDGASYIETEFDTWGRPYRVTNPYRAGETKHWTTTRFDALGRPIMVIPPDGSDITNRTTYSYSGNTVTVTDPTDKKRKSETDALGRLVKVTEPDANGVLNVDTTYEYTLLDALATVTQGVQGRTYSYDDLGRLLNARTPETNQQPVSYQYNDFGLVTQRTDARGVITNYDYDTLNRLRQVSYNVGSTGVPATATVVYTYGTNATQNNNGRLLTMTDGLGSETYSYDVLGRVTQVQKVISGTAYTTIYAYNLAGELTSITYPSGRVVQQSYDVAGRLCAVGASGSSCSAGPRYTQDFSYNPAGQVTAFSYGNGVIASLGYSPERLQVVTLSYAKGLTNLLNLTYGYTQNGGNNGQITGITDVVEAGRTTTYTYDALYRLKTAVSAGSANYPQWGLSWTYDRYGNRTAQTVTAGSAPSNALTVDPVTNRITGPGFSYDANGNMTADGLNSLTYDAENRVVSLNGGATTHSYDGNGLRVKKIAGSTTTVYIFSGTNVIAEYVNGAAPASPSREYIHSGGQLLATLEGGTTTYHQRDHLSVRVTTDAAGTKIGEGGHYPFGDAQAWYETGTTTKWKFTSYERDGESLNDYAMARYYANRLGRFHSPDLLASPIADPQSLNRYAYVGNDPVNFVDPLGLFRRQPSEEDEDGGGGWPDSTGLMEMLICFYTNLCDPDISEKFVDPDPEQPAPQPPAPRTGAPPVQPCIDTSNAAHRQSQAMDISTAAWRGLAGYGEIVNSPITGTVVNAKTNGTGPYPPNAPAELAGEANYVRIQNSQNTVTLTHVNSPIPIGTTVYGGKPVGVTDATGRQDAPHVHFTVRDSQGNLLDPRTFLPDCRPPG